MIQPKEKDIQKWIDALRSGKYEQTSSTLQDKHGYCCLGVACKIFIAKDKLQVYTKSKFIKGCTPESQRFSPKWLTDISYQCNLPDLNDTMGLTFDEIADYLQAIYIEKVLD